MLLPQQLLQQTLYSITLSPLALGPLKVNMPSFLPVHTHKAWRLWLNVFFFSCVEAADTKLSTEHKYASLMCEQ